MPIAKPHAGVGLPPSALEQAVVAAAAGDGALRAQAVGDPFEHRAIVIVEAAHEPRIDLERDAAVGEELLQAVEVRARRRRRGARRAVGAPAIISCMSGFLESRMRSGFACSRRLRVGVELGRACSRNTRRDRRDASAALVGDRRSN